MEKLLLIKTLKLSVSEKLIYALYHFFTPFMIFAVILNQEELNINSVSPVVCIFILFFSLFLLIRGIVSYRQFAQIDEENLYICIKEGKNVKTLDRITKDSITGFAITGFGKICAVVNGKKIKVIDISPSIIPIILTIPFLSIPFFGKKKNLSDTTLFYLNSFIGKESKEERKLIVWDIFCWLCLALIVFVGLLGLLYFFLFLIIDSFTAS